MSIRLNIKRLAFGGGKIRPSSSGEPCSPQRRRNALTIFAITLFAALFVAPVLAGCSRGDEPVRTDPTTRALTHADSVRLGLIIEIRVDTAWDGTIDVKF